MTYTKLTFLGTDACIPTVGNDTASYLLNDEVVVDVGWHITETLLRRGHTSGEINALFFTHMHHDHMMALPAFLYQRYARNDADQLHIYGPEPLLRALEDAKRFLQLDVFWPNAKQPHVHILKGGDQAETRTFTVRVLDSDHAVPGLCYRFEDKRTNVTLGFTGDSAYRECFGAFFGGCDVLVHEYSFGLEKTAENIQRHSDIRDAALVAQQAKVGMFCPVHGPLALRKACEAEARKKYQGELYWPRANDQLLIAGKRE